MKVAVVSETYPPDINGVAMTLGHVVRGLSGMGHHVQLIRPRQGAGDSRRREGSLETIPCAGMPIPFYTMQKCGLPATGFLLDLWRGNPPQVLYVATEGPLGFSALQAARLLRIPAVSGFHTNFGSYGAHYHVSWLTPLVERYLRTFHNMSDCTVTPTLEQATMLRNCGYRNVHVLGRGVDSDLYNPRRRDAALRRKWGVPGDGQAVLYVGRLAEEKNLDLAVKAFEAMEAANSHSRFVLVGDGPMRERLAREYPDFVFCGWRRGEELARHYASGDIFLFPSTTETFGNVTTEAMASGLAVVAYDYAAAGRYIRHGESGLLADVGNAAAFVDCAVRLAGRPAEARGMGRNARRATRALSWQVVCLRFTRILQTTVR
jgi:glycosyltransferase involved in cell wall biosynthesis